MLTRTGLLLISTLLFHNGFGQTENNPLYDVSKKFHFGFGIGLNGSDLRVANSELFYTQNSFTKVSVTSFPFVALQPLCNIHLKQRLDLRLILNFSLTQRNIDFTHIHGFVETKTISSAYLGVPVLLKYKSVRHRNWRFYTIGGLEYAYDLESNEGSEQNISEPFVALREHNYYYSYGMGFDLYYPLFKLSPELRVSNGIGNVLVPNTDAYSSMFAGAKNRMIWLSFFFE